LELGERIELLRKTVSGIMLTLLLIGMLTFAFNIQPVKAEPKTIYVNGDNSVGPWDGTPEHPYQNITSGLEHAVDYDTVFVYSGTYYEHVTVDKALSLVGEDKSNSIIDGGGTGTALNIASNDTIVANFTIRNANVGIAFYHTWGWIFENRFLSNNVGVFLFRSPGNEIFRNTFSNNNVGIELNETADTAYEFTDEIFRNDISNNNVGIKLYQSYKSRFWRNNFIDNTIHVSSTDSGGKWTWFTAWLAYQGNYWSGYSGVDNFSGKFQNETGSDGVVDAPYNVTANEPVQNAYYPFWYVEDPDMFFSCIGNDIDYYPYTEPWIDPGWLWGIEDGQVWGANIYWTMPLQLEDRFIVEGLVENPLNMTFRELLTFPLWSETAPIICGPPGPYEVITYKWIGLSLSCLLNLAKVEENATEVVFWGDDNFYSSLDIETAMESHTLLALKGNGTFLSEVDNVSNLQRRQSGFRLVVPCRYGYKWVKNIVRIQVVDYDSKGNLEGLPYDWDADYNEGRIPNCTLPLRIRVPNGDFDMLVGSVNNTVIGYRNIGDSRDQEWARESTWDIPDVPGDRDRASPTVGDLDNDGDYDLLISNAMNVPPMGYKNIGNMTHPIWERCPGWDVPNTGSYEQDAFLVDLDNDGDLDVLVSDASGVLGFRNNGTVTNPEWVREEDWDLKGPLLVGGWQCPTVADLDNDGDFDMMMGQNYNGNIAAYGYENNGTACNPSWKRKPEWDTPVDPGVASKHKRPALVDIDSDGDYDLFIGVGTDILAYENNGTVTSPCWSRKPEWDFLCVTPSKTAGNWTRPVFVDLDADIHDIAVVSIMLSKTVVGQGYSVLIGVGFWNYGNHAETFNLTVYANTTSIAAQTVTLTSGNSTTITFTWNTTGFALGNYIISAYAWPVPGETDTADNTFTDGIVTVTIIFLFLEGPFYWNGVEYWIVQYGERRPVRLISNYY